MEYMCFNQNGDISILNDGSLKLVDKFTYLGSSISSTKNDISIWLVKAWTAIDRLLVIWKLDLSDKIKRNFFRAAVMSILYGCTSWMLTKHREKAWWQLHKDSMSYIKKILGATCHLEDHPNQMNKTCGTLLEEQGWTHKWFSPVDPFTQMCKCRTTC